MTTDIIINSHNYGKFLKEAIESVLAQTKTDYTIVVADDGSTDDTSEVAKETLRGKCSNWAILNADDVGPTNARNLAVQQTEGEYILFLDADDKIDPIYLERAESVLSKSEDNIGFVYVDSVYFGEQNISFKQPEYSFFNLIQNNFISYCSLMKRSAFERVGYDLNNFAYLEDYQLWLRLGAKGYYGIHLAEPLFYYRVHKSSSYQSKRRQVLEKFYRYYIIDQMPEIHPPEWVDVAKKELKKLPKDFMSWKPREQEKLIERIV